MYVLAYRKESHTRNHCPVLRLRDLIESISSESFRLHWLTDAANLVLAFWWHCVGCRRWYEVLDGRIGRVVYVAKMEREELSMLQRTDGGSLGLGVTAGYKS